MKHAERPYYILKCSYSLQDVDRFLVLLRHLFKCISYRKRVNSIYLQISYKDQKTIFLDTAIFLATDLTSYAKMISLEFEKWRAIYASVSGVGDVLA